jgi:hypothetical protein
VRVSANHRRAPLQSGSRWKCAARSMDGLVGIDPGAEVADTGVDGGEGGAAGGLAPRRGSNEHVTARQRATAVTAASADGARLNADVAVVDLRRRPGVGAGGVRLHHHVALLERVGNAAGAAGSPPSSDGASLPGVVAGVGGGHGDVAGVAVRGDVGEMQNGDVVGVALVAVVDEAAVPGEGGEGAESAGAAVGHGTITGSGQGRVGSNGSAAAVSRADRLGSTDKGSSAGVRVADSKRHLPRVVGDVGIAAAHNARIGVLTERRQRQAQQQ